MIENGKQKVSQSIIFFFWFLFYPEKCIESQIKHCDKNMGHLNIIHVGINK